MNRLLAIDAQARLNHYHDAGLVVDGLWGPASRGGLDAANRSLGLSRLRHGTEALRRHNSGLIRIIWHWTAGAAGINDVERRSYHMIVGQDNRVHPGFLMPEANADIRDGKYAAHTRNLNTGSIGIAFDGMHGAVERPFRPGPAPITHEMVRVMAEELADLSETYSIPITPWTMMSHAEVQGTLGVRQRRKWDTMWLPGMSGPGDARAVGDKMRAMVRQYAMDDAA